MERLLKFDCTAGAPPAQTTMTTPLTIVMLSGWSGCGKDAAASLMIEEMHFARFAFADAVKEECSLIYALPLERFYHGKDRPLERPVVAWPSARTPRDLLLLHAADARKKDDALYARMVATAIKSSDAQRIVISDWRHHVEMETLQVEFPDAQIITVRIVRTAVTQRPECNEHELDGVTPHITIHNDGSISDLRDALKSRLRPYIHRPVSPPVLLK
jgi:hypothetical protein